MALTRTWPVSLDTLLAKSGSTPLGGGNDEHLPIGMAGSYTCKAALKFSLDWTGVTKVVSARLYLKTTTKVHATSWGATPTIYVERQTTGNFQENSGRSSYDSPAGSGWSTAASDFDSANVQPTGVDRVSWTPGDNESTWYSVDITAMANSWAPASVLRSTGTPGGAAANYGLLIRPTANAVSETIEFYSRKSGSDPYIVLTYDSNTAPNAPTSPSPASGAVVATTTPTLSWLYDDPQNDASSAYQVQVATDPAFTAIVWDSGVVALVQADNTTMSVVCGTALTRGTTYYWRVATRDAAGLVSAWSSTWNLIVNSLPVATLTEPSATGRLGKVGYTAGAGWASPRLSVAWSYSDAQGQAQSDYELEVITDNAGAPTGAVIASGVVTSAVTSVVVAGTLVENTRYHVRVRVKDGLEWSAWSGFYIVRVRWGFTVHQKDVSIAAAPPTSWQVTVINAPVDPATQAIAIEYNSCDDAAGTNLGPTWQPSLATVTKRKFVRYRVWFMAWGASPAPLPALLDLTIRTSGLTVQPERWLPSPISGQKGSIEFSDRVFGTQSLRLDGDGSPHYITQQVPIEPDTNYVLQARIKSYGNSGAKAYLSDTQNGAPLTGIETATATADQPWTQRIGPVWNSGSRTSVWVTLYINGATGTVGLFDGLKMERGRVTSPWTPGLVGVGVAIDSGGVQIDATNDSGAIFRLRTSGGNVIELGPDTLYLDGSPLGGGVYVDEDPPPTPTDGMLWWDTDDATFGPDTTDKGTAFPLSPALYRTYFRTDLGMSFFWNGTYWLSTQLLCASSSTEANATAYFIASSASKARVMVASLVTAIGTDVFIESIAIGVAVSSGGTALSASHKWSLDFKVGNAAIPVVALASIVLDSGASGIFKVGKVNINALRGAEATNPVISMDIVKTGTPGDLNNLSPFNVFFRVVAT